ncbi:2OG-Fe(II) oxygenase [Winogradskyella aurantiaca]|uniref:2OG-Fe(II) oxygenase n=1 Tax=Winogradskyella aurantiaca TaxID=2219558 RepID=UPI000E1C46DD|nr:2OG-Fe(II) oxygenase [Winogradskyella aurantiaca]
MNRIEIANLILAEINSNRDKLKSSFSASKEKIGYFYIDDLLPQELASELALVFPKTKDMRRLKSIREYKYISAQMNEHHPLLEETIYAFQDKRIVDLIGNICGIDSLYPDGLLYAGGLSSMGKDNFLNPHLDNSHDAERERWRVLNLLFYVSKDWRLNNGGHLELWPNGPKKESIVIESRFNRLVVMATHQFSWHSVNKVNVNESRNCISNYYFSEEPLKSDDRFHVTKYRGRPNQFFLNAILDFDAFARMTLRKLFRKGIRKNPHIYKKG